MFKIKQLDMQNKKKCKWWIYRHVFLSTSTKNSSLNKEEILSAISFFFFLTVWLDEYEPSYNERIVLFCCFFVFLITNSPSLQCPRSLQTDNFYLNLGKLLFLSSDFLLGLSVKNPVYLIIAITLRNPDTSHGIFPWYL